MAETTLFEHFTVGVQFERDDLVEFRQGLSLAKKFGAGLTVVHAIPPIESPWSHEPLTEVVDLEHAALVSASEAVERILQLHQIPGAGAHGGRQVALDATVEFGYASALLRQVAGQHHNSCIVVGAPGGGHLARLGSTVRVLLGQSGHPIWVHRGAVALPKRLRVAMDLTPAGRALGAFVLALGEALSIGVQLVHCFEVAEYSLGMKGREEGGDYEFSIPNIRKSIEASWDEFLETLPPATIEVESEFVEGAVVDALLGLETPGTLTVLGTRSKAGSGPGLLGRIPWELCRQSEGSVLVVPPGA